MPYVLSAVAAHTNPASRAAAPSVCFRALPSAAIGACAVLSPRELCSHPPRPAQPQLQPAARAPLLRPEIFFFLCAARASAVCGFFTTTTRSFDAPRRFDQGVRACASVSPCVLLFPSASRIVRTYMATRHVRLAPRGKGRAKCVCRLYVYADQKWGHGACVSLSICSHTEITYIYWAVYSCVCVCMYGSMGRETVWHALWFQEAGGRWIRPSLLVVLVTATWLGYVLLSYRTF